MLCLAISSYRWIETPLRKGNWFGKRWKTLLVGGGVLVMVSGGIITLAKPLKGQLFAGKKYLTPETPTDKIPQKFADDLLERKFAIAGNSHSDHVGALVTSVFGDKVFHLRKSFPCETWTRYSDSRSFRMQCFFDSNLVDLLGKLDNGDYLIISSRHRGIYVGGFYNNRLKFIPNRLDESDFRRYENEFWDQIKDIATEAQKKSIKVVFFMPLPEFNTFTYGDFCSPQWFNEYSLKGMDRQCLPTISREALNDRLSDNSYRRLGEILANNRNFAAVDFMSDFCDFSSCSPIHRMRNEYLFRDPNHINKQKSAELRAAMLTQLHDRFGSKRNLQNHPSD